MKHEPKGLSQRGRQIAIDTLMQIKKLLREKKPKAAIARMTKVSRKTVQRVEKMDAEEIWERKVAAIDRLPDLDI